MSRVSRDEQSRSFHIFPAACDGCQCIPTTMVVTMTMKLTIMMVMVMTMTIVVMMLPEKPY